MGDRNSMTTLVSSTVYGIEELLDRIYTLLTTFGYEVWMSHKGTMPVDPHLSNLENCLTAVERCDLFLGLITPYYGSGVDETGTSITHYEMQKAIELNKPRWILAHDHIQFARSFLGKLGYDTPDERKKLALLKNKIFSNLRIIDMYEEAIISDLPSGERKGNWVQKYRTDEDALLFATAQFSRYQEVEAFIRENLSEPESVKEKIDRIGGSP